MPENKPTSPIASLDIFAYEFATPVKDGARAILSDSAKKDWADILWQFENYLKGFSFFQKITTADLKFKLVSKDEPILRAVIGIKIEHLEENFFFYSDIEFPGAPSCENNDRYCKIKSSNYDDKRKITTDYIYTTDKVARVLIQHFRSITIDQLSELDKKICTEK